MMTTKEKKEYHRRYYQEHKEKWILNTPEKKAKKRRTGRRYWKNRSEGARAKEAKRTTSRNKDPKTKERKRNWALKRYHSRTELEKLADRRRARLYMRTRNSIPSRKILNRLRSRLHKALKRPNTKKIARTLELVGCTSDQLIEYLKSLFTDGMTLEDLYSGKIEIDHIRPCVSFDLSIPEQQKLCFHYSNLQPLWSVDNRRKNASYADPTATATSL